MQKKVMLVDDAAIIRLILRDILTACGYEVVAECETGREAVEKYKELKPDLVTLDITMPEMSGLEALNEILKFDPQAKIVMVTAVDEKESLIRAVKLGASDYIVKPFEEERVIAAVKNIFETKS